MKKLLFLISAALIFKSNAQVNAQQRTCGTPVLPAQYEDWVSSLKPTPGKYGSATIQSIFNIPVIVHIIHNNEAINSINATSGNNIHAAQVIDQINILNKDYNGLNADTNLIPAVFKPLLGKFQVNFCLAVVNPTGGILAEPGIDRINRVTQSWSALPYSSTYIDGTVKPATIWDPTKYLNIWIAPLSGGLLGYATFPAPGTSGLQGLTGSFGTATSDGVVILTTSFGSVGTAQSGAYNKGRTATHEIGHWIGLRHIWGDASCGTDYCNDTPPAQNSNYNCPVFPYKLGTCSGNTTGEMTMNYMDYTNDACMYMFTADQKYRAQLILVNSPMRVALVTSTACNLPAVGNDIGISYVAKPTYSQTFNCLTYIDPVVNVTNYGNTTLTSATFTFNVDGVNTQTLSWTGSAAPNTSFTFALTQITGIGLGAHNFNVSVLSPNGGIDNNLSNNVNNQKFTIGYNFPFNAPSGTTCPGSSLVLTASGATSYSWSTGATTASVSLNPLVTTVYTVTATFGGCVVPKPVTVTVQAPPVIALNKTHVCEGMASVITATGASSYVWSSGESSSSISVTLASSANYTVTGSTSSGCASTQTFNILVDPAPTASILPSNVTCNTCSDATLSVIASGGTAPYTYNWTPGNITTASAPNLAVDCYTVTITDSKGCKTAEAACVSFDTGIRDRTISNSLIKILPNPSTGKFVIEFNFQGTKNVEILDALGKSIQKVETVSNSAAIDISAYADGIYYARISSDSNFTTVKLVKTK